ncbi:hypothetical protein NUM3379_25020 [Kineococcus sp. NUM-3379]
MVGRGQAGLDRGDVGGRGLAQAPAAQFAVATVTDLWYLARRAVHRWERVLDAELREAVGHPLGTYALLCALQEPACTNQQDVAGMLGLTKGSVSRQVDAAVRAGLVVAEVSPSSRREKQVRPTPAGEEVLRRGGGLLARRAPDAPPGDVAATLRTPAGIGARTGATAPEG